MYGDTQNEQSKALATRSSGRRPSTWSHSAVRRPMAAISLREKSTRLGTGEVVPVVSKAVSARPTRNGSTP